MPNWKALGQLTVLSSAAIFLLAAGSAFKQWMDSPIAIMPFTIVQDPRTVGLSADTLFDQTKADISTIYGESGDLFEQRKLGEPTVPLDVKIGSTGWTLQTLTSALGIRLTSAVVSARLESQDGRLVLRSTTDSASGIEVDKLLVAESVTGVHEPPAADAAAGFEVDRAVACLALRVVARISPDVAANFLHKRAASADGSHDGKRGDECIAAGDEDLYSEVSTDETRPPAARVNALVGLSVHYSAAHELFEELTMAQAATEMATRLLACDDVDAWPTRWQCIQCKASAFHPFSDKNRRAQIAAWMQLGMAWSDYASAARTLHEMRQRRQYAIDAYDRVIGIKASYALAHDAKGLQLSLRNQPADAEAAYRQSLKSGETSPAHLDLALLSLHGRSDFLAEPMVKEEDLRGAEIQLRRAIDLNPRYWDAHAELGYVLFRSRRYQDAADVLEAALQHDESNRDARLLLGAAYARLCRFGSAYALFKDAYSSQRGGTAAAWRLNLLTDWGRLLDLFGQHSAAIEQETAVLEQAPALVDALRIRGQIKLTLAGESADEIQSGLADLRAAVDHDAAKADANLQAYLAALLRAGHPAEATDAYEAWIRQGLVPPMAANDGMESVILPSLPTTRLAFATALLATGRAAEAAGEFAVLTQLGVAQGGPPAASRPAQNARGGAQGAGLTPVSEVTDGPAAVPVAGPPERHEECSSPTNDSPRLIDEPPLVTALMPPERRLIEPYAGRGGPVAAGLDR